MAHAASAATRTFYFNAYNAGDETWDSGEANVVDGSTATAGNENENGGYLPLTSSTCLGVELGVISIVELRVYFENNYDVNSSRTIVPRLIPYFNGTDVGDNHNPAPGDYDGAGFPAWSAYFDITTDTNAPAIWTWTDVANLDCRLEAYRPNSGRVDVYQVEMRVTYTPRRRIITAR